MLNFLRIKKKYRKFRNSLKGKIKEIRKSGLFDDHYYLKKNNDVLLSGLEPIAHFAEFGWKEGRKPNVNFDDCFYKNYYSDIKNINENPFLHYLRYGVREKRCVNMIGLQNSLRQSYRVERYLKQKKTRKAKVVLYTAIIGSYDQLLIPEYICDDWDYVCFTDQDILSDSVFQISKPEYIATDNCRTSRFIKTQPHLYFKGYEYSIWVDASILIRSNHISHTLNFCHDNNINFMASKHPWRNCIYDEALECERANKDNKNIMRKQIKKYELEGMAKHFGLLATGIIIRQHNNEKMIKLGTEWWNEIKTGSKRDQLSIMYLLWKKNIAYRTLPVGKDILSTEDYFWINHLI